MSETKAKKGLFQKFLDVVETVGNKLPHPVMIFLFLSLAVVVISEIAARAGVSVSYESFDKAKGQSVTITKAAIGLLNPEGIRFMFSKAVANFTGFAPLGTVLVAMLGVGVAEDSGLIGSLLRRIVMKTPKKLITAVVVFLGVMSNIASDAGYVVLVPLGAVIFLSFKRHPLAGLAAAFAGVSGGFSANLLIGTLDPLLGGISTEAARLVSPGYTVTPTANFYFMFASTFLITALGTLVTEKIVEPRLGEYKGSQKVEIEDLTPEQKKGLRASGIAFMVFIAVILAMVVPQNGILRNPKTHEILSGSAFMDGIVPIIMLFFLIPGVFYGLFAGTIKNSKGVISAMSKSMASMGGYLVLSFVAAQFIAYFSHSNLGIIVAVNGANFLKATGMTGFPLIIAFVIISALINLLMASASAKWAIMAPIFIPMLMGVGFSPEFTQTAFRVGDSTTNIITPLMSYFAVIVVFAQKYDEDTGIGTLISTMLPYSIVFFIGWTSFLVLWYFLGLPVGPNAPIMIPPLM